MRKLLIAIITVPLLTAGLLTGYVWYHSKQQVDRLVKQLAPLADAKYASLYASPLGAVIINHIRITPHDSYSALSIEKLRLQTPDLWTLIHLQDELQQGHIPASMELTARGVEVPLHALPFQAAARATQTTAGQNTVIAFEALGCGDIPAFGLDEYLAMGYETFVFDQTLAYQYDKRNGRLIFTADSVMQDSAAMTWEFVLTFLPPEGELIAAPKLVRGQFSYTDLSFNQRRNTFCAQQAQSTVKDYVDGHIRLTRQWLQTAGVLPSDGLVEVYREFVATDGGRFDIQLTPHSELDFATLVYYQPHQIVDLLQPRITVNGEAADNISLQFVQQPVAAPTSAGEPAALAAVVTADPPAGIEKTPLHSTTETVVPKSTAAIASPGENTGAAVVADDLTIASNEISTHVGRAIIVKTREGKRYQGRLVNADTNSLQIKINMLGGSVAYWLNFSDIEEIKMRR
jgi:hypothetical protein